MAKMEYAAEILRGWPADGARERVEIVTQGAILVNGDVVTSQADGTVNKVGATRTNQVGLVIRGNGDSASAANSLGRLQTPQAIVAITATWAGGLLTVTQAAHGYASGNSVTIAATAGSGAFASYNGTYTITVTSASTYTIQVANYGTITTGTAQLTGISNSGKAVVLWGNYIARVSNFTAGAWAPGSPVTAQSGKYTIGATFSQSGTSPFAVTPADPQVGYCIRVQGATATETAHIVIVAF